MKLTILVLLVDNTGYDELVHSAADEEHFIMVLPERNFNIKVTTPWKLFMYSDEALSPELKESLKHFIHYADDPKFVRYDFFSMYKGVLKEDNKGYNFFLSPRMFRKDVVLKDDSVYPLNVEALQGETILNGFIWDRESYRKKFMVL